MKKIVILSGAGMSAESGLATFRGNHGLWENHRIQDVATPEAWERNRNLVLGFYNARRRAMRLASPNSGHTEIARWSRHADIFIITQNVDDLHERAGSPGVLHLHGELAKARSTKDPSIVIPLDRDDILEGDLCPLGSQLRPHIVWFGEAVPLMEEAAEIVATADALVVVGTSLQVYPAASLAWLAPKNARRILIDPDPPSAPGFETIAAPASTGLPRAAALLGIPPGA
ncbi:MAG: SIR2 family NAD-dependent protein deacylase [Terrimicrobiaceae bacterium]